MNNCFVGLMMISGVVINPCFIGNGINFKHKDSGECLFYTIGGERVIVKESCEEVVEKINSKMEGFGR